MATALEYARSRGLAINHLETDVLDYIRALQSEDSHIEDSLKDQDRQLFAPGDNFFREKPSIEKSGACYLAESIRMPENIHSEDRLPTYRLTDLRIEPPLLEECEQEHTCSFSHETASNLQALLQLGDLRVQQWEGCDWTPQELALASQYTKKAQTEKLDIDRSSLLSMQRCLKVNDISDELPRIIELDLKFERVSLMQAKDYGN